MVKPQVVDLSSLIQGRGQNPGLWASASLFERACGKFAGYAPYRFPEEPPPGHDFLLAVGGGTLIDRAKVWRRQKSPSTRLAVIPSIWGSGAENSKVAVVNTAEGKVIYTGEEYLADERSVWPEATVGLSGELVRYACGDTWAHALEGFLSPLADGPLELELADLIRRLTAQEIANDPAWFELSAEAGAGQTRSGVGLIHGLAHTLEPILSRKGIGGGPFGHARLCALFAWPVFRLDRALSGKADAKFVRWGLDPAAVEGKLRRLFNGADFDRLFPVVAENWKAVVQHPFTRINCALVRMGDLERLRGSAVP